MNWRMPRSISANPVVRVRRARSYAPTIWRRRDRARITMYSAPTHERQDRHVQAWQTIHWQP